MYKIRFKILCLFSLFSLLFFSVDTSFANKKTKVIPRKTKQISDFEEKYLFGGKAQERNPQQLKRMIKGFSLLLKNLPAGVDRNKKILARASSYLALSRYYRVEAKTTKKNKNREILYAKKARKDVQYISTSKFSDNKMKAKANYYLGLVDLYIKTRSSAKEYFIKSLELDSQSEQAPAIALIVAETYFEEGKYLKAIEYYGSYFKIYNFKQKTLAVYKTAWSELNLEEYEKAESSFLEVITNSNYKSFSNDAFNDLAMTVTLHRDESDILSFARKKMNRKELEYLDFLTQVLRNLQAQNGVNRKSIIFAELEKKEKDPYRKLRLYVSNIANLQKEYASMAPMIDFRAILKYVKQKNIKANSPSFIKLVPEFEPELLSLIQVFSETHSGKIKKIEKIPDKVLAKSLRDMTGFHISYFPKSPHLDASYLVLLNICKQLKEEKCIYKQSKLILSKENLKKVHHSAHLELLKVLDSFYKKDKKFYDEYESYLSLFLTKYPEDEFWYQLAKTITVLYNEKNNYKKSVFYLDKIHQKEKTDESFYRLQLAHFNLKKYKKIISPKDNFLKSKYANEIKSMERESYLALAKVSSDENDFESYRDYLKKFLQLNPNKEKQLIAQRDYLSKLWKLEKYDEMHSELINFSVKSRLGKDYEDFTKKLLEYYIQYAKFQKAFSLVSSENQDNRFKAFEFYWLQSKLALDSVLDKNLATLFHKLDKEKKLYFSKILARYNSKSYLNYIDEILPKNIQEKKMALYALQMKYGSEQFKVPTHYISYLEPVLKPELKRYGKSEIQNKIIQFKVTNQFSSDKERNDFIQKWILFAREVRKQIADDLRNRFIDERLNIITMAKDLELQLSNLILSSPIPGQLTEEESKEYKQGLDKLSQEFIEQSQEYQKIIDGLQKKLASSNSNKVFEFLNFWNLPWPNKRMQADFKRLLKAENYIGAIILLDHWRALDDLSDKNYYNYKIRLAKEANNNSFMANEIFQELLNDKIQDLVDQWRRDI